MFSLYVETRFSISIEVGDVAPKGYTCRCLVIGQSFDPTLHEAVMREPSDEQVEDVVLEELQRGYHINGKVLRHALVKVSMGPGPKNETSEQPEQSLNETQSGDNADSMKKEI